MAWSKNFNKDEYQKEQEQKRMELQSRVTEIVDNFSNSSEAVVEFLEFSSKFHNYSSNNRMLMMQQNRGASFAGSFQKFKELGYSVKKGEHGMKIFVPTICTMFYNPENNRWEQLRTATAAQKRMIKSGELESRKVQHFKLGTVFDIAQTDCPTEDYPKILGMGYTSEQHANLFSAVATYCEDRGIPVEVSDLSSITLRGYYSPVNNSITLSDKLNDSMKVSVLTHELSHALMHNDIEINKSTAQKEVEADSLSLMLRKSLGIEEVEDTRQSHLQASFKEYLKENSNLEKEELNNNIKELFSGIITTYDEMYEDFNNTIETQMKLQQENELSAEKINEIANTMLDGVDLTPSEELNKAIDNYIKSSHLVEPSDDKNNSSISDLQECIEGLDWNISDCNFSNGVGWELEKYSPAGEDFIFTIEHNNSVAQAIRKIQDYSYNFDAQEHLEEWVRLKAENVKYIPQINVLIKDADCIQKMLDELSKCCENFDVINSQKLTVNDIQSLLNAELPKDEITSFIQQNSISESINDIEKPFFELNWCNNHPEYYSKMTIANGEKFVSLLNKNAAEKEQTNYSKFTVHIDAINKYVGYINIGAEEGGLIDHINNFAEQDVPAQLAAGEITADEAEATITGLKSLSKELYSLTEKGSEMVHSNDMQQNTESFLAQEQENQMMQEDFMQL